MNRIKAVIFDIDGTLADSLRVWSESDRIFLERRGITYSEDISAALKSMHFSSAVSYLRERFRLSGTDEDIGKEITDIVREKYLHEVRLMPGAKEFIELCRENGIKMCAATSNSRELAEGVLKNRGIYKHLDFIITSDEAGSGKEKPDIFFMCAEKMGTEPYETAVIEDSPHAAKTAFDGGFFTVGVDNGYFGDFEMLSGITHIRTKNLESFGELFMKR